jgi:hypothetical protein
MQNDIVPANKKNIIKKRSIICVLFVSIILENKSEYFISKSDNKSKNILE